MKRLFLISCFLFFFFSSAFADPFSDALTPIIDQMKTQALAVISAVIPAVVAILVASFSIIAIMWAAQKMKASMDDDVFEYRRSRSMSDAEWDDVEKNLSDDDQQRQDLIEEYGYYD